jgi:hypothetical protein
MVTEGTSAFVSMDTKQHDTYKYEWTMEQSALRGTRATAAHTMVQILLTIQISPKILWYFRVDRAREQSARASEDASRPPGRVLKSRRPLMLRTTVLGTRSAAFQLRAKTGRDPNGTTQFPGERDR